MKPPGPGFRRLPAPRLAARIRQRCGLVMLALLPLMVNISAAQAPPKLADPIPEPALSAILAAFDKYEVVALPQGHGMQDLNDFIFSLIRTPAFSEKVNDIEVEFGNSLYQPMLDRYIAGENVPFTEVQKVWRKMGQPASGASGFVEQFFPLVRALNQKLPPERRLRVLAGDSPVDWDQIKSMDDVIRLVHRDASIASVMEKEVLSKHRKALMLFGTFHLMHGSAAARCRSTKRTIQTSRLSLASLAFSIRTRQLYPAARSRAGRSRRWRGQRERGWAPWI